MDRYNKIFHTRRSIRLKGYDYAQAGMYFVTVCVQKKVCLFGEIVDNEMILNETGIIVCDEWIKSEVIRKNVKLHEFVVMPNHFHGIIEITGQLHDDVVALRATPLHHPLPQQRPYSRTVVKNEYMSSISPKCGELATIVRAFKSATTKRINELNRSAGEKLWQQNYYETIINDDESFYRIADYIVNNPANWKDDKFNIT